MLKALEISGFKSFADKTRFEFPPGITVVVGPNGSGKSNIVDAIKWVLGEQSAKSLRGKDMSDVIFKGSSGANSRKPSGSASATIILDNSQNLFDSDADEILVTRRVYRSGESEYLINDEPCRLKDIKALFRGTGVGTDAYSLIEQGKVERILSSGAKDRRAIFEEAAGISRFKAKKIEAQRRLARVETNLVRLADIVDEVGSRYRSVKNQASKAAKYKELSDRLQELRTFVGLKDWTTFSSKVTDTETKMVQLQSEAEKLNTEINDHQISVKEIETQLDEISSGVVQKQENANKVREKVAQTESQLELNQSRKSDLTQRIDQLKSQLEKFESRKTELTSRLQQCQTELDSAKSEHGSATASLEKLAVETDTLRQRGERLALESTQNREKHTELVSIISDLGRAISGHKSQFDSLEESKQRLRDQISELQQSVSAKQSRLEALVAERERLEQDAADNDNQLADARENAEESNSRLAELRNRLSELNSRFSGVTQRAKVISELEKKLEGINAGAKQLLQQSQTENETAFSDVIGLVADLVQVNVKHASIVDAALGEVAQYVVVDGHALIDAIESEKIKVKGRVGIVQLDAKSGLGGDATVNLADEPGVIGRADNLVHGDEKYHPFVNQLLGGTWLVKTLGDAIRLRNEKTDRVRFVSLDGEVVEADGTVIVGPKSSAAGLVSRRSELRALKKELVSLEQEIESAKTAVSEWEQTHSENEKNVEALINLNTDLSTKLADQSSQADAVEQQLADIRKRLNAANSEESELTQRHQDLAAMLDKDQSQFQAHELTVNQLVEQLQSSETESTTVQDQLRELEEQMTVAKVNLAKSDQILRDMTTRTEETNRELQDHEDSNSEFTEQFESANKGIKNATEFIETANAQLTELLKERDSLEDELTTFTEKRVAIDKQRREIANALNQKRDQVRSVQDDLHHQEMRNKQLLMEREQLATRLFEDYGIEIDKLNGEATAEEEAERQEIDEEITRLRKQIGRIGHVNMDALKELEELESRYQKLDEQYQDLVQAKEALIKIIQRINTDSRKLFTETLEAIRVNFQKLFRQTFGGGQADLIIEDGVDPLEAGIEIVATPPGKPSFNNSLLSGGEKALTAVSLLMAIFQFRPSPFCVLDEVDAPFDEANIGRFVDVLKSFLSWTKFVIVTHSKKTMTAATTLYGVTMQESGVSKRVSVRFEDVSEDGHISEEALRRSEDDEQAA